MRFTARLQETFPITAERFALFSRAVLEAHKRSWRPQVFHCHDWQSALVPVLLRTGAGKTNGGCRKFPRAGSQGQRARKLSRASLVHTKQTLAKRRIAID